MGLLYLNMRAGAAHRHGFPGHCSLMCKLVFPEVTGRSHVWHVDMCAHPMLSVSPAFVPVLTTTDSQGRVHTTHLLVPLPAMFGLFRD